MKLFFETTLNYIACRLRIRDTCIRDGSAEGKGMQRGRGRVGERAFKSAAFAASIIKRPRARRLIVGILTRLSIDKIDLAKARCLRRVSAAWRVNETFRAIIFLYGSRVDSSSFSARSSRVPRARWSRRSSCRLHHRDNIGDPVSLSDEMADEIIRSSFGVNRPSRSRNRNVRTEVLIKRRIGSAASSTLLLSAAR